MLGGYGRLYGAFVGAVAYMVLSHYLAKIYPTAWQLGLGLLLIVIALFARNGILGMVDAIGARGAQARSHHDRAAARDPRRSAATSARWRPRATSTSGSSAAPATR